MKQYSKPQVTIDLEEYQQLLSDKKMATFTRRVGNNIDVRFSELENGQVFVVVYNKERTMIIGHMDFVDTKTKDSIINDWEIQFIRKPNGHRT